MNHKSIQKKKGSESEGVRRDEWGARMTPEHSKIGGGNEKTLRQQA